MPAGKSSSLNRADIPHRDSADLINKTEIPSLYHHNNEPTWAVLGWAGVSCCPVSRHYLIKTSHFKLFTASRLSWRSHTC